MHIVVLERGSRAVEAVLIEVLNVLSVLSCLLVVDDFPVVCSIVPYTVLFLSGQKEGEFDEHVRFS